MLMQRLRSDTACDTACTFQVISAFRFETRQFDYTDAWMPAAQHQLQEQSGTLNHTGLVFYFCVTSLQLVSSRSSGDPADVSERL
jgi:hypothetical protein